MKKLNLNTIARLAVIALVASATTSTAQASKLAELDDHSWTLERTAIRADRDVRYDFRNAPVAQCLRENFCRIAEKADDLQAMIGRKADARMLRKIEACMDEIDESFAEIQKAMDQLRIWTAKCEPQTIRYGSIRIGVCSSSQQLDLKQLCARVDLMKETLKCMFDTLDKLFCECGIKRPHAHHDRERLAPAPPVRELRSDPPVIRREFRAHPQQSSHGGQKFGSHGGFGSRSRHGRTVSIPIGNSRSGFHLSFLIK
jgi:hypothetical protein